MAAPKFAPTDPTDDPRGYAPTDHVPDGWTPHRPGDLTGRQPVGRLLGSQGPDQGYALVLARRLQPSIRLAEGQHVEDAVAGCLGVALRRASIFGRAPVIHDVRIALIIWGYLDDSPPPELVAIRERMFEAVADSSHHYAEARAIVDMVPESTLRMTPEQVQAAYPGRWRELLGVD